MTRKPRAREQEMDSFMHTISGNGANIPAIGFGTWTLRGQEAEKLVAGAIEAGYRHIDTAAMYENEEAVGDGLRASGEARDSIFLTTKVWFTDLQDGPLQRSVEASLHKLKTDYVDLALIHWPSPTIPITEAIPALNDVRNRGLARHIGVSNFPVALLNEAARLSEHKLACNQIEYHPFLKQDKLLAACRELGMAVTSYCPLARGGELFDDDAIAGPARKHGKTPAQVVLRWHVQQDGVAAIPRSSKLERVQENLDVFDFALEPEEMEAISALRSRGLRICDFDFAPQWDEG